MVDKQAVTSISIGSKLVVAHVPNMARRTGNRKGQIIREGTRLFSKSGYDKVTVKQIADACGITEPAVYRHFESKDSVYVSVLEALGDRLTHEQVFDSLRTVNDIDRLLRTLALHIVSFFSNNADIYRLLLFSALRGHPHATRIYRLIRGTYQDFLTEQLNRLFESGLIIRKNNEITARCFIGMVFDCALGMTLWKGMQGTVFPPNDVVANNVPIYVRGMTE